ncbi:MAG TPA: hypothetical protein PLS53_10910 [Thermoanaerobaculaceae bacterium]|nr:hypothetical protein [Thermoanaerobaculaceae bacterium]
MPLHVTPTAQKFWTEVFEATGGCVMAAALRTNRSPAHVGRWRAVIYGARIHCRKNSTLNQDHVDELIAAIHAGVRQIDMAHRFGVSRSTLQRMIDRYGLPLRRAPRSARKRSAEIDFSPGEALVGSGPHGQHCTDPGAAALRLPEAER